MNRKLRILYGASHRILRYEEIPLFIKAGFEVIPVKAHWHVFKTYEPDADNVNHPLYPEWQQSCSIPESEITKIQNIDIFKYHDLNKSSGKITKKEIALLNKWIDIIYIPNLLPAVPRMLEWFEGITLFRVYGEGKIMTYDQWAADSGVSLDLLRKHDKRYVAMLMLYSLNGPEHQSILGSNVFHVGPCVSKDRIVKEWKAEKASKICNTALSYISENHHWTSIYHELCELFTDIPLRILGKNNKTREPNKSDDRIIGLLANDNEYLELLTDCVCLIDPGTSPFHTHYTPLEAILMGIPVIFLEDSGMGQEILRVLPKEKLQDSGMCKSFSEVLEITKRCLADFTYAEKIASNQTIIAETMFSPQTVFNEIKLFADAAPTILTHIKKVAPLKTTNHLTKKTIKNFSIDTIKYIPLLLLKNVINAIRLIHKTILPTRYHQQSSQFFFQSCFPIKYEQFQGMHYNVTPQPSVTYHTNYAEKNINIPLFIRQRSYLAKNGQRLKSNKIAVFFDLEHMNISAISDFSIKTFCQFPEKFHIFSKISNAQKTNTILNKISTLLGMNHQHLKIFDGDQYEEMNEQFQYTANLFVLGSSEFNLDTFNYAINLYKYRQHNYLYFHDGVYTELLFNWAKINNYSWHELIQHYYPHTLLKGLRTEDLLNDKIHLIAPIFELTGTLNVFINANNCIPIIKNEIENDKINIFNAFLPIPDYKKISQTNNESDNIFTLAHFGILNPFKQIDKLIKTIKIIRRISNATANAKLLLAGFGVTAYIENLRDTDKQFITIEESPTHERMLTLMKNADVITQLRWPNMGQASGIVSELIGMGRKCITTEGFINDHFKNCVIEVSPDITPENLADIIWNNKDNMSIPEKDHTEILNQFSFTASANLIFNTMIDRASKKTEMRQSLSRT